MVVFVGICIVGKNLNPVSSTVPCDEGKTTETICLPGSCRRTLNNPITVYNYIPTSGTLC